MIAPFLRGPLAGALAVAGLLAALPLAPAHANDPGADGLFGQGIRGAVVLKGKLWVHGFGGLGWVDLTNGVRHVEIPNGVIDMVRWNGQVWALRRRADLPAPNPEQSRYSAYYWRGGGFAELPPLSAKTSAGPLRLAMSSAGPRLIGTTTIWSMPKGGTQWSARPIHWPAGETGAGFTLSAATLDGRSIYLARPTGKLLRLDVASGRAATLPGGAVAGLVADPEASACAYVAYAEGPAAATALVRACAGALQPMTKVGDVEAPEPTTGLAADADALWVQTPTSVWRLTDKARDRFPIGAWTPLTTLQIARPAPGAVLVQTTLHPAPLLAAGQ